MNDGVKAGDNLLRSYVSRFENLMQQQKDTASDMKDLATEAKGHGLDPVALKALAKRSFETETQAIKRREKERVVDDYSSALGIEW